jgi:hypothetical protein
MFLNNLCYNHVIFLSKSGRSSNIPIGFLRCPDGSGLPLEWTGSALPKLFLGLITDIQINYILIAQYNNIRNIPFESLRNPYLELQMRIIQQDN